MFVFSISAVTFGLTFSFIMLLIINSFDSSSNYSSLGLKIVTSLFIISGLIMALSGALVFI